MCADKRINSKFNVRHGHHVGGVKTPTYAVWVGIRRRCLKANNNGYYLYGGRGITICDRWNDFENFLSDMGERPDGMTIDRINNEIGYEPGNCRWATSSEQARNRRTCRRVSRDDGLVFNTVVEAAEQTGSNQSAIYAVCNGRSKTHKGHSWRYL